MIRANEDALVCDFAEYYHILDYRSLPVSLAATLLYGLCDDSRCKMYVSGRKATIEALILARIYDDVQWLCWAQSEDGVHKRNRPGSLYNELIQKKNDGREVVGFDTAEDFEQAWKEGTKHGG